MDEGMEAVEEYLAERQERLQQRFRRIADLRVWPQDIAAMLGRHVVGQDEAVRRMATLCRAHMRRMQDAIEDGTAMQPPRQRGEAAPVLLIGPSGVGKSHLIRTMAQITSLPCVIEDASSQSATGYVGRSVSDTLAQLVIRADGEIGLGRWGIVALDEFDKLRRRTTGGGLDVSGEGVQRCMLCLLDGGTVQVEWPPSGSRSGRQWFPFAASNLMVILAGAFEGLDEVVASRLGVRKGRMGFGATNVGGGGQDRQHMLSQVTPEDLVAYGFLPEVVGRIRDVVVMRELTQDDLRRILMEAPDGPLVAQQRIAGREGFRFSLTDDLADAIVAEAMSRGLGARSLHTILARVTHRALFEVPAKTYPPRATLRTVELGVAALHDGTYSLLPTRKRRSRSDPEVTSGI